MFANLIITIVKLFHQLKRALSSLFGLNRVYYFNASLNEWWHHFLLGFDRNWPGSVLYQISVEAKFSCVTRRWPNAVVESEPDTVHFCYVVLPQYAFEISDLRPRTKAWIRVDSVKLTLAYEEVTVRNDEVSVEISPSRSLHAMHRPHNLVDPCVLQIFVLEDLHLWIIRSEWHMGCGVPVPRSYDEVKHSVLPELVYKGDDFLGARDSETASLAKVVLDVHDYESGFLCH